MKPRTQLERFLPVIVHTRVHHILDTAFRECYQTERNVKRIKCEWSGTLNSSQINLYRANGVNETIIDVHLNEFTFTGVVRIHEPLIIEFVGDSSVRILLEGASF